MQVRQTNASHARVREVLHYNTETGALTWLLRLSPRGLVGSIAGSVKPNGYRVIQLDGKPYLAHRIAWFWVHGVWPSKFLDHRDGDRDNNRIGNLREACYWVNNQNRTKANRNSRTGVIGVHPHGDKFEARIRTKTHTRMYLGRFDTIQEASEAYAAAKAKYHDGPPT